MGVRNWKITPTASPATKGKTDKEDKTVAKFMDALSKDMDEDDKKEETEVREKERKQEQQTLQFPHDEKDDNHSSTNQ